MPAALRRALRGGGGVHLAAFPAGVRRAAVAPTITRNRRRSTCPIRRRRAWTCSRAATRTASCNAPAAARSPASSATSSSCTAARCGSSRSSRCSQEVEAWQARGASQVFFADDNFIGNRAYAKELLRALARWNARQRQAAVVLYAGQHRHGPRRGAARTAARRQLRLGLHRHRVAPQGQPGRDPQDPEREARPGRGGPQDPIVQPVHLRRHDRGLRPGRRRRIFDEQYAFSRRRRSRSSCSACCWRCRGRRCTSA